MELVRYTPDMIELLFDENEHLVAVKVINGWQEIVYGPWQQPDTIRVITKE